MQHTILVIEDFADARDLMRLLLEAEGYRVLEARNGIDGVETAKRENPDAILMDMSLPLMDGCEATMRIRKSPKLSSTPIIACTAHNELDWRSKATQAGCTDFLNKPIDADILLAMLSHHLR